MNSITIQTVDGITHGPIEVVNSVPELAAYSNSVATQNALQAAYDLGNWEPYESPQTEPEPLPPDWPAFRLALLKSAMFRAWSELLPATWREDLKMAALVANAEALQVTYNHCAALTLPGPAAVAEWQQIADQNQIPVTFIVASE
ncbi:hypothetical protein IQ265_23230 [Nodosilinea sp. LEGE 06152]|uniref:hypothetical protein n=1 Tax=Nodosilinea sp. LEGE 06152 TaxID=2777966 RepID=UPI00187E5C00|nr:hypothetical protein [Nodosilinea sp. LEGE 06152]MBE9159725.1 hypothetical protein [Nodosilinea sp. LEGE 06152]